MKKEQVRSGLVLGLLVVGCGDPNDGQPVTTVGQSVWNSAVTVLVLENQGGGFVPPPPAGSQCMLAAGRYTLTVAARGLAWVRCVGDYKSMEPFKQVSGQRVLSEAEFRDLSGVLEKLTVVANNNQCGADKSTFSATVTTARGSQVYGDGFYACDIKDRPLLEFGALGQALTRMGTLAQ